MPQAQVTAMKLARLQPKVRTISTAAVSSHNPVKYGYDAFRQTSADRGYGHRWRKFRADYLRKHPLCVDCERDGFVEAATELDHLIPHRGDMVKFWAGPFQGLCRSHHSAKTARGE